MRGHIQRRVRRDGGCTYRVIFDAGRTAEGKRDFKTRSFDTEREAEEELIRLNAERLAGTMVATTRQTYGEFLDHWLTISKHRRVEDTTADNYEQMIRTHIKPVLGEVPLQALSAQQLERFLADKADHGRLDGRGGLSDRMVRLLSFLLNASLTTAYKQRLVAANEMAFVEPPPRRKAIQEVLMWSPEQLVTFMRVSATHALHPLWPVALVTGMRREELLGLRWQDANLQAGSPLLRIMQVAVCLRGRAEIRDRAKNPSSARRVAIDQATAQLLREHRVRQLERKLRQGAAWQDRDLVFAGDTGAPLDPGGVSKAFVRLVERAGLPRVTLHGLRHMSASYGLADAREMVGVSRRLGHAKVSTTTDIYGHPLADSDRAIAEAIARRMYGPPDDDVTKMVTN